MTKKKKPLSDQDAALWQAVKEEITPLRRSRVPLVSASKTATVKPVKRRNRPPPPPTVAAVRQAIPPSMNNLDGRRAQRLRRGQLPIDGRIDLHGMTQDRAHRTLNAYLARAQADGKRCVLVITGKGGVEKPDPDNVFATKRTGILRHVVPEWLSEGENAARVNAWHPARPNHGGDGALYVVLKRVR